MQSRLTRKNLPLIGKIQKKVDIEALLKYCHNNGYTDYDNFKDVIYSTDAHVSNIVRHEYPTSMISSVDQNFHGDLYKQLYMTQLDEYGSSSSSDSLQNKENHFTRIRRANSDTNYYISAADEYNYTSRTKHSKGLLNDIINLFKSPVTRVRLAVMMPNTEIKPHVDYDPSYITRYHIPIITDDKVEFWMERNKQVTCHAMPADGSIYFFNAGIKHWVINRSNINRLHMIIDTNGQEDLELSEQNL